MAVIPTAPLLPHASFFSHPLPYALGAMAAAVAFASVGLHLSTTEAEVKEHLSPSESFRHFQISYPLLRNMQVGYILVTVASGATAAMLSVGYTRRLFTIASVITGLVLPFTLATLIPLNKQIIDTPPQQATEKSRELLNQWALINLVRPIATITSAAIFAAGICYRRVYV